MPSELFYTINISFSITVSVLGLIFSLLTIFIIINDRQCHTVNNLLICDLCVASTLYFIVYSIGCFYGLRDDWYSNQPLCTVRAYLIIVSLAANSYSFLIQAISRLFFAIFYKHRFLLSWRTHWILIILKWLLNFLVSIRPFFIEHGFELIQDLRMCTGTTEILSVALYIIIMSYIVPVSIVTIVYGIILYQVRQSTRRVTANITPGALPFRTSAPSAKRNLQIMRNVLKLLHIILCGGTLFLILIPWDIIQHQSVPKELFFLAVNCVTLSFTIMIIVSFFTNKTIKDAIFRYVARHPLFTF